MAYWRQNEGNIEPRNGTAPCRNSYPRSAPVYAPAALPEGMVNPGSTNPSSGFRANPIYLTTYPTFGDHDGLSGRLMAVAQADTYDTSQNPWPACGVWDQPGAGIAASELIRLAPTTSAHMGLAQATGAGPTMVFQAPPVFSYQSKPIYAVGL
jgi:hypothetical protein